MSSELSNKNGRINPRNMKEIGVYLTRYLHKSALCADVETTLMEYLGMLDDYDIEEFVERLGEEYESSGREKVSKDTAVTLGVFSVLSVFFNVLISGNNERKKLPHLQDLLDHNAYKESPKKTFQKYLTDYRTAMEECQFQMCLSYLKDRFKRPLDAARASATADFILGHLVEDADDGNTANTANTGQNANSSNTNNQDADPEARPTYADVKPSNPFPEPPVKNTEVKSSDTKPVREDVKDFTQSLLDRPRSFPSSRKSEANTTRKEEPRDISSMFRSYQKKPSSDRLFPEDDQEVDQGSETDSQSETGSESRSESDSQSETGSESGSESDSVSSSTSSSESEDDRDRRRHHKSSHKKKSHSSKSKSSRKNIDIDELLGLKKKSKR